MIPYIFLCSLHKNKIKQQTYCGRNTNTFDARQISDKTLRILFMQAYFIA